MKTKHFILIAILATYSVTNLFAQNLNMAPAFYYVPKNKSKELKDVKGSAYIQKSYQPIKVVGFDDNNYKGKYNAFNDEMEIQLAPNKLIALEKNRHYDVLFKNTNTLYRTYSFTDEYGNRQRGFFVVLSENDKGTAVLKKEAVKYYDKVKAKNSYERDQPAMFERLKDEYYVYRNNDVTELPKSKNRIAKAFPDISNEIKSMIKTNDLSVKEEADIIKIAEFIIENKKP